MIKTDKQDIGAKRKNSFKFLVATYGETATDSETDIECLPHNSPLADAPLGLKVNPPTQV